MTKTSEILKRFDDEIKTDRNMDRIGQSYREGARDIIEVYVKEEMREFLKNPDNLQLRQKLINWIKEIEGLK